MSKVSLQPFQADEFARAIYDKDLMISELQMQLIAWEAELETEEVHGKLIRKPKQFHMETEDKEVSRQLKM